MVGLLGKKIGMTQVFTDDGRAVGVTVIEAGPCPVLAVGEKSIQLGFEERSEKKTNKPAAGFFKKINVVPRTFIREVARDSSKEYKVGDELKADVFTKGDYVDVIGTSIGKGFQGGMKRWHWKGGPQTHGSTSHRRVGSIGSTTTPGRVWKGHHMAGHMGNVRTTVQNLEVVLTDVEQNVILVRGAVPGHKNGYVIIRSAKKKKVRAKAHAPAAQAKGKAAPAKSAPAKKK